VLAVRTKSGLALSRVDVHGATVTPAYTIAKSPLLVNHRLVAFAGKTIIAFSPGFGIDLAAVSLDGPQ
jgi:hypothetical protein